ncbi:MAG TPA: hypothetical protein VJZ50_08310, partial [Candidatus Limnocylindrales bacterium]|nr:hypothetical protein [Candidatus Limnocylindrales bacterium]
MARDLLGPENSVLVACLPQVRDLGHDESWHDEVEFDSGKDLDAACVVVIIGVPAAYSGPESTI